MKKLTAILAGMLFLTSCSQFTSSEKESAGLKTTADNLADAYVGCVVNNSLSSQTQAVIDVATVAEVAQSRCEPELDQFRSAQDAYLKTQIMMTEKPVQQSVDALEKRATTEAVEALIAAAENQPAPAAVPAVTATAAAATGAAASASSAKTVAAPSANGWSAEQRIYLDCMDDQAAKYAGLDESAGVIADVAQSRCKSYMAGPDTAALESEGRTLVMGAVLDAKLQGSGRPAADQPVN